MDVAAQDLAELLSCHADEVAAAADVAFADAGPRIAVTPILAFIAVFIFMSTIAIGALLKKQVEGAAAEFIGRHR